jgi:isopenicillin-N epimerase
MQAQLEPLIVSWGWRPDDPDVSPFVDLLQRQGTRDPAAFLAVPDALAFQAAHDWDRVRAECHTLVGFARAEMGRLTGQPPLVTDARWHVQMATLPLPPDAPTDLAARLLAEYGIEIPLTRWGTRPCLRLSVQGYTTRTDVERLLTAVETLLFPAGGHR